jgi:hypothetical protein
MLTSCLVTPFDVVKTRMQIQIEYKNKQDCINTNLNECVKQECIACTGEKQIKFQSTFVNK